MQASGYICGWYYIPHSCSFSCALSSAELNHRVCPSLSSPPTSGLTEQLHHWRSAPTTARCGVGSQTSPLAEQKKASLGCKLVYERVSTACFRPSKIALRISQQRLRETGLGVTKHTSKCVKESIRVILPGRPPGCLNLTQFL